MKKTGTKHAKKREIRAFFWVLGSKFKPETVFWAKRKIFTFFHFFSRFFHFFRGFGGRNLPSELGYRQEMKKSEKK